jgi:hypothetical protein
LCFCKTEIFLLEVLDNGKCGLRNGALICPSGTD